MHVLRLSDLSSACIREVLELARAVKQNPSEYKQSLAGKSLVLIFEKTSTRTAVSYQVAMFELGGFSLILNWAASNLVISPVRYETQYISRNCQAIMARLKSHSTLLDMAGASLVPVINGCDDRYHPSQALADYLTVWEKLGRLEGARLCYVGARNNVANSLIEGALALGVELRLVTPVAQPAAVDPDLDARVGASQGQVSFCEDLKASVDWADFVYTDTWVDMENFNDPAYAKEKTERMERLLPYQLNKKLLRDSKARIMHDMPVHPGLEIAAELIESPQSVIYEQAANRLHAQKGLLLKLLA